VQGEAKRPGQGEDTEQPEQRPSSREEPETGASESPGVLSAATPKDLLRQITEYDNAVARASGGEPGLALRPLRCAIDAGPEKGQDKGKERVWLPTKGRERPWAVGEDRIREARDARGPTERGGSGSRAEKGSPGGDPQGGELSLEGTRPGRAHGHREASGGISAASTIAVGASPSSSPASEGRFIHIIRDKSNPVGSRREREQQQQEASREGDAQPKAATITMSWQGSHRSPMRGGKISMGLAPAPAVYSKPKSAVSQGRRAQRAHSEPNPDRKGMVASSTDENVSLPVIEGPHPANPAGANWRDGVPEDSSIARAESTLYSPPHASTKSPKNLQGGMSPMNPVGIKDLLSGLPRTPSKAKHSGSISPQNLSGGPSNQDGATPALKAQQTGACAAWVMLPERQVLLPGSSKQRRSGISASYGSRVGYAPDLDRMVERRRSKGSANDG